MEFDFDMPGGIVKVCQNETIEMLPQPERGHCEYCGCFSKMDARGCCICCGAPMTSLWALPLMVWKTTQDPYMWR